MARVRVGLAAIPTCPHPYLDLLNCCSDEDLSTAPWSFFSSFITFLFFLYPLNDEKITKEGVDQGVAHSTYYVIKQTLAHMI